MPSVKVSEVSEALSNFWTQLGPSPYTHTHTERALYPLYPTSTLYLYYLYCTSLYLSPPTQRSAIPKVPSTLCTSTHYLYPVVPSTLYLFTSVQYVQR